MSPYVRLGISAAAGMGAAVLAALVIAVLDMYLAGHGHGSITREVLSWNALGIHLSIGDVALLVVTATASISTWMVLGRRA